MRGCQVLVFKNIVQVNYFVVEFKCVDFRLFIFIIFVFMTDTKKIKLKALQKYCDGVQYLMTVSITNYILAHVQAALA